MKPDDPALFKYVPPRLRRVRRASSGVDGGRWLRDLGVAWVNGVCGPLVKGVSRVLGKGVPLVWPVSLPLARGVDLWLPDPWPAAGIALNRLSNLMSLRLADNHCSNHGLDCSWADLFALLAHT